MHRRCTESTCRRFFPIGRSAPVRCPYCGTGYPRVQPDPRAGQDTFGYSVRADFTAMTFVEIQQIISEFRWQGHYFRPQTVALGYGMSQRDANALCRALRLRGIPADILPTWNARQARMTLIRI